MKRPHFVPLLLATYLIMPPPVVAGTRFQINFSAPLSRWVELRRFNSASECDTALAVYRHKPAGGLPMMLEDRQQAIAAMWASRCISAKDPRLKGN